MPDRRFGRALLLRDTQGVANAHTLLPFEVAPIVSRFDGRSSCEDIARLVSKEIGESVPVTFVVQLANELEEALFADGPAYQRERSRIERDFANAPVRPASHAGGAYHDDPEKLTDYIESECLATRAANGKPPGELVAVVAPHIDPWRGARCYGEAYGEVRTALPANVDTFVLFGTSHAPMREPFALCRKAFDTPLGRLEADVDAIDEIARACEFDPYTDQFNHKREHSLEFQAVFLKHVLGDRPARIIPVLAGLGEHQSSGKSPSTSKTVEKFFEAMQNLVGKKQAFLVAGADLAHVGPRFGDPEPYDEAQRRALEASDRASLDRVARHEPEAFWWHVCADLDARRVCGLGPIYALLRSLTARAVGHVRHYEQTVDPSEGSIVSHGAIAFYR